MATYRVKRFSAQDLSMNGQGGDKISSKDLAIENMKMQRELMRNQRQEQKLREEERKRDLKAQIEAQKQDQKENQEDKKNMTRLQVSTQGNENPGAQHTGLYKKSTAAVKPVSMKNG